MCVLRTYQAYIGLFTANKLNRIATRISHRHRAARQCTLFSIPFCPLRFSVFLMPNSHCPTWPDLTRPDPTRLYKTIPGFLQPMNAKYSHQWTRRVTRSRSFQLSSFAVNKPVLAAKRDWLTTLYGWPAAMAARVFRAILPDLVFGRRGTTITSLKLATGPTCSRTLAITSLMRSVRPISVSETSRNKHRATVVGLTQQHSRV